MSRERTNAFKKGLIGITQSEEQGDKGLKDSEQSIRDIWDTVKM